jgi:hypothetical protein
MTMAQTMRSEDILHCFQVREMKNVFTLPHYCGSTSNVAT